jgi:hypothetical protein
MFSSAACTRMASVFGLPLMSNKAEQHKIKGKGTVLHILMFPFAS